MLYELLPLLSFLRGCCSVMYDVCTGEEVGVMVRLQRIAEVDM